MGQWLVWAAALLCWTLTVQATRSTLCDMMPNCNACIRKRDELTKRWCGWLVGHTAQLLPVATCVSGNETMPDQNVIKSMALMDYYWNRTHCSDCMLGDGVGNYSQQCSTCSKRPGECVLCSDEHQFHGLCIPNELDCPKTIPLRTEFSADVCFKQTDCHSCTGSVETNDVCTGASKCNWCVDVFDQHVGSCVPCDSERCTRCADYTPPISVALYCPSRCPTVGDKECSGQGVCIPDLGVCKCSENFYGDVCEVSCTSNVTCQNSGICDPDAYGQCQCEYPYMGKRCEFGTQPIIDYI